MDNKRSKDNQKSRQSQVGQQDRQGQRDQQGSELSNSKQQRGESGSHQSNR